MAHSWLMGLCCSKQRLWDFLLLRDQSSSQRMLRLRDFSQCVDSGNNLSRGALHEVDGSVTLTVPKFIY